MIQSGIRNPSQTGAQGAPEQHRQQVRQPQGAALSGIGTVNNSIVAPYDELQKQLTHVARHLLSPPFAQRANKAGTLCVQPACRMAGISNEGSCELVHSEAFTRHLRSKSWLQTRDSAVLPIQSPTARGRIPNPRMTLVSLGTCTGQQT